MQNKILQHHNQNLPTAQSLASGPIKPAKDSIMSKILAAKAATRAPQPDQEHDNNEAKAAP